MIARTPILGLMLAVAAGAASDANAQNEAEPRIDYATGDYVFAEDLPPEAQNDVVTQTVDPDADIDRGAERVIPARQGTVPFVTRPVVQPLLGEVPAVAQPYPAPLTYTVAPAAPYPVYAPPAAAAPVPYGYAPGYAYPMAGYVPAGAQIVSFDRQTWLAQCRDRLGDYAEDERDAVIAALARASGGVPPLPGIGDRCAAYLDDYMARATSGALRMPIAPGQQYMLVPVTVVVPQ